MTEFVVFLLTSTAVLAGTWWGYRLGGRKIADSLFPLLGGGLLAVGAICLGFSRSWYWPWGIVSPILLALSVYGLGYYLVRKLCLKRSTQGRSRTTVRNRIYGGVLGGSTAFLGAVVVWLLAILVNGYTASTPPTYLADATVVLPDQPDSQDWAHSLVRVAHHGFVRHLPIAGPLSDELEAVAQILRTPVEIRQEFTRHKNWDDIVELDVFQDIAENEALLREFDAVSSGNLAALYRLQKHPLLVEFVAEPKVQEMLADLTATQIAQEMAAFQEQRR